MKPSQPVAVGMAAIYAWAVWPQALADHASGHVPSNIPLVAASIGSTTTTTFVFGFSTIADAEYELPTNVLVLKSNGITDPRG